MDYKGNVLGLPAERVGPGYRGGPLDCLGIRPVDGQLKPVFGDGNGKYYLEQLRERAAHPGLVQVYPAGDGSFTRDYKMNGGNGNAARQNTGVSNSRS